MKWYPLVLAAGLVFLLSAAVSVEFYQYTDKDGTVRYTDDPALVPEDQREKVTIHESIQSEPGEELTNEGEVTPETVEQEGSETSDEAVTADAAEETADTPETVETGEAGGMIVPPAGKAEIAAERKTSGDLNADREVLLQSYKALEAEKSALGPPPPKNSKSGVLADYEQKTIELNKKTEAYNQESMAFEEKVKAFNNQVGKK